MSLWDRVRSVIGANPMAAPRRPTVDDAEARRRTERALTRAAIVLARRERIDAEVDRVERYLRGGQ